VLSDITRQHFQGEMERQPEAKEEICDETRRFSLDGSGMFVATVAITLTH
jgi:hypothetical protein